MPPDYLAEDVVEVRVTTLGDPDRGGAAPAADAGRKSADEPPEQLPDQESVADASDASLRAIRSSRQSRSAARPGERVLLEAREVFGEPGA